MNLRKFVLHLFFILSSFSPPLPLLITIILFFPPSPPFPAPLGPLFRLRALRRENKRERETRTALKRKTKVRGRDAFKYWDYAQVCGLGERGEEFSSSSERAFFYSSVYWSEEEDGIFGFLFFCFFFVFFLFLWCFFCGFFCISFFVFLYFNIKLLLSVKKKNGKFIISFLWTPSNFRSCCWCIFFFFFSFSFLSFTTITKFLKSGQKQVCFKIFSKDHKLEILLIFRGVVGVVSMIQLFVFFYYFLFYFNYFN